MEIFPPKDGRGGAREGAGRPVGSGKYGETTIRMRIPHSMEKSIKSFITEGQGWKIPLYSSRIAAGTPSWADDHIEDRINLAESLVRNPAKSFCVRATGDSMINAGISSGDMLIVDEEIEPQNGYIVVAAVDGDLTVKRLHKTSNVLTLLPENDAYLPIPITEETAFHIFGVVTNIIKSAMK